MKEFFPFFQSFDQPSIGEGEKIFIPSVLPLYTLRTIEKKKRKTERGNRERERERSIFKRIFPEKSSEIKVR